MRWYTENNQISWMWNWNSIVCLHTHTYTHTHWTPTCLFIFSHRREWAKGPKCKIYMPETTNALTHTQRPLSNRMRPVIFPPLILDVSAKWEVKSQIWDVTFSLPPCLLPPPLPPSAPSIRRPFCSAHLYLIASPSASTWRSHNTHSAPIWAMVAYRHVELMDFIRSMARLFWGWSKGVLRNWQRKRQR